MRIQIEDIAVKVKILDVKKLKAIISLDCGEFVVKGYRVQMSEYPNHKGDKLWVTPPSYLAGTKYHPMFFVPDKEIWEKLEQKIWDAYYEQRDNHEKKMYDLPTSVEEDEIVSKF